MNYKQYRRVRILITAMIAIIVSCAVIINNFYLALTGIIIGILFMSLANKRFKEVIVDERVVSVSGRASRLTYSITVVLFAFTGLFLMFSARGNNDAYLESIGVLLSYVAMFMIAVYSVSFHYVNKKYGGN